MAPTTKTDSIVVIAGYGPGISASVAKKFASLGYTKIALLSRRQTKLDAAAAELVATHNISAKGFAVDLSNPTAVQTVLAAIREDLAGTIGVLFWNPYGKPQGIFDLTAEGLDNNIASSVTSLVLAVQRIVDDLAANNGAVLLTGAGLSLENDTFVQMTVDWNAATQAISKAAQRKTVHILHFALKPKGIFVGEVTVLESVKGTPFDVAQTATLTPEAVANKFAELESKRDAIFVSAP
ncbi:hypothetical protein HK100_001209 [Physocladia obscura]|uniref:Short-chain dehydrogenase/reductase n=1 Tax=Physocladia obscura TaxID=109957 RepID=A0AAD5SY87_9FUNG|nr:hypothetical protein HK100_001209 [Physocladia obscura]